MAKERTSAAFRAFLGGVDAIRQTQEQRFREEETQKARDFQAGEAEKTRANQNFLSQQQINAAAKNLRMQIENSKSQHQETLAQTKYLTEQGWIKDAEARTADITMRIKMHNEGLIATKAANLMTYNASQMRENMSYFEQYGVTPPATWQYDAQGRMLPAGHPSYWGMLNGSGNNSSSDILGRGIDTPNPVPVAKEAVNVTNFPTEVVDSVNKLVGQIQNQKPDRVQPMGWVGAPIPPYKDKAPLTGEELSKTLSANEPKAINQALTKLNDNIKMRKGIITSEDKRKAVKTLNEAGRYYQGMMTIFNDPEQSLDINNKVRNVIAKYYANKLVEVGDLLESYSTKLPSWGGKGQQEIVQRP